MSQREYKVVESFNHAYLSQIRQIAQLQIYQDNRIYYRSLKMLSRSTKYIID